MYRSISSYRRKDGTANRVAYYRCRGTGNAPSKCGNMIRCDLVDALTHMTFMEDVDLDGQAMVTGVLAKLPVFERVTISGEDYASEIAEIEDRIHDLDLDDPDFDAKQAALGSERRTLKGLPVDVTRVEERATGQTVGEVWESLDHAGQRRYLLACDFRVYAADGAAHMEGDPTKITGALRTIAA